VLTAGGPQWARSVDGMGWSHRRTCRAIAVAVVVSVTATLTAASAGRTPGVPDNDEMIVIRLDGTLPLDHRWRDCRCWISSLSGVASRRTDPPGRCGAGHCGWMASPGVWRLATSLAPSAALSRPWAVARPPVRTAGPSAAVGRLRSDVRWILPPWSRPQAWCLRHSSYGIRHSRRNRPACGPGTSHSPVTTTVTGSVTSACTVRPTGPGECAPALTGRSADRRGGAHRTVLRWGDRHAVVVGAASPASSPTEQAVFQ
jgi:hypothetical protein